MILVLGQADRHQPWRRPTASIVLTQGQYLRTFSFTSPYGEGHYHHLVSSATAHLRPLNFTRGQIGARHTPYENLFVVPSQAHQFGRGTILLVDTHIGDGGLSKFAFWPSTTTHDPADLLVESATPATAGGVDQDWGRLSILFHPNKASQYLGVGAKWLAVPPKLDGGIPYNHYTKKVQVEKAYVGESFPSAYEPARQVNVVVRPDRINLAVNVTDPVGASTSTTSNVSFDGDLWTEVTTSAVDPSPVGVRTLADEETLRDGEFYTTQWEVANTGSTPLTVTVTWCGSETYMTSILPGIRKRIHVTGNRDGLGYTPTYRYADLLVTPGDTFLVRDVMIEKGVDLKPFFNGSTNEDTVWEGAVMASRSHYYNDRLVRHATINKILESNVPSGIGIGEPQFGVTPKDW